MAGVHQPSSNPSQRRSNRIRTVCGFPGYRAEHPDAGPSRGGLGRQADAAPPKDIAEVRNAFEIQERLEEPGPYSIDALLAAHGVMMRGPESEAGSCSRFYDAGLVPRESAFRILWQCVKNTDWCDGNEQEATACMYGRCGRCLRKGPPLFKLGTLYNDRDVLELVRKKAAACASISVTSWVSRRLSTALGMWRNSSNTGTMADFTLEKQMKWIENNLLNTM